MGTRGHFGFYIRGRRRGAYKHCDAYPEGLGKDIVNFILSLTPEDYATMARLVAEITWVQAEPKPSPELKERYQKLGFANTIIQNGSLDEWFALLYNTQGAAGLSAIKSGALNHMEESTFKGGDWEYAYFIDFENHLLETWAYEKPVNVFSFEELVRDGVEAYLARVIEEITD